MSTPAPSTTAASSTSLINAQRDLVALAARVCDASLAQLVRVNARRQPHAQCSVGDARLMKGLNALHAHALLREDALWIADTHSPQWMAYGTLPPAPGLAHFYAAAPLMTDDGRCLGILSLADERPREITGRLRSTLSSLARQMTVLDEQRRLQRELVALVRRQCVSSAKMITLCAHCHRVKESEGAWVQLESFIQQHIARPISHGMCPGCAHAELESFKSRITTLKNTRRPERSEGSEGSSVASCGCSEGSSTIDAGCSEGSSTIDAEPSEPPPA